MIQAIRQGINKNEVLTALVGMAGGIILTYLTAIQGHDQAIIRIETQIEGLTTIINGSMDDRYRGSDAKRDLEFRDHQITENAARIMKLEEKVNRVTR